MLSMLAPFHIYNLKIFIPFYTLLPHILDCLNNRNFNLSTVQFTYCLSSHLTSWCHKRNCSYVSF